MASKITTLPVCMDEENITQVSALSSPSIPRNSGCIIYRLPTEILENTFIDCAHDYHSDARGHPLQTAPSWVNVSYVSHHWRKVALNCPTLWSYLFIVSPRWTEELLARSKQAPLKVHVTPDRRDKIFPELCFVEQVMNHVERIQELRLHFPFAYCVIGLQCFSLLSSRPAPRLQTLEISTDGSSANWTSLLFDGDTPALRTLDLMDCPVPWYLLKLTSLTTLSLCYVPVKLQQNMAEFLTTLSEMRDLTHLYLEDALASAAGFLSSIAFPGFQKINLPRLSRLLIVAPLSTVVALLSCVKLPLKTELRLDCGVEHNYTSLDDYGTLSSLLAQRFATFNEQASSGPTIRSLVVASSEWRKVTLSFSTLERDFSSVIISSMDWGRSVPLQIVLHFGPSTTAGDMDHITSQICCPIQFPNVQALHVIRPPLFLTFWSHVLGQLPNLRYIKLSHGPMPNLAQLLSFVPHDSTENRVEHANRIFAPALEELELYRIIFSTIPEAPLIVADVQSLCDALTARTAPRVRLSMNQCIERNPDRNKTFNTVGWWEGGRLQYSPLHPE